MAKGKRRREFTCGSCMVDFSIDVEPSYDDETVFKQFKGSVVWLNKKVMFCPVCETALVEKP
jgi:hypothetical protein